MNIKHSLNYISLNYKKILIFCGLILVLSGLIVLTGWRADIFNLKVLFIGNNTVAPNTALCFILIGLILILLQFNFHNVKKLLTFISLFIIVISALTLSEYITGADLRIDNLLVSKYIPLLNVRMAIFTSVALIFTGLSQILNNIRLKVSPLASLLLLAVVLSFGLFNIIIYLLDISYPLGFKSSIPPSLGASGLIVFSSLVLIIDQFWSKGVRLDELQVILLGIAIAISLIFQTEFLAYERESFTNKSIIIVNEANQIQDFLNLTKSDVDNYQNSLRGYILTSDKELLDRTEHAKQDIQLRIMQSDSLLNGQNEIKTQFKIANRYIDERIKFSENVLEAYKSHGRDSAAKMLGQEYGIILVDSVEKQLDRISIREDKVQSSEIKNEISLSGRKMFALIGVGIVLLFIILIAVIYQTLMFIKIQKRSIGELNRMNTRVKLAIEASNSGTIDWDIQNHTINWSDEFLKLNGLDSSAPPTIETLEKSLHPDDLLMTREKIAETLETGRPLSFEYRIIMPDKSVKWLHAAAKKVISEGGFVTLTGICFDITDLKIKEIELSRVNNTLKIAQEAGKAGVWEWDVVANSLYRSEELFKLYGINPSASEPYHNLFNTVHPDDKERVLMTIQSAIVNKDPLITDYRIICHDGTIKWIRLVARTEYDGEKPLKVTGICHDVSDLKEVQDQLKKAKTEAESANKTKSDFLLNISHEFRTPLNAIIGYAELLEKAEGNSRKKYSQSINTSGIRLLSMVDDILDLINFEKTEFELNWDYVETFAFFSEIERNFSAKVSEKGLVLKTDIDQNLPTSIRMDGRRLSQIVTSLVDNAINFTDSGEVAIITRTLNKNNKIKKTDLILEVRDTGRGMSEDFQKRLFESFSQAEKKTVHGGIGVGLALTKLIVDKMKGTINVISQLGMGSKFVITLPGISFKEEVQAVSSPEEANRQIQKEADEKEEIIDPAGLIDSLEGSLLETYKSFELRQPLEKVKMFGLSLFELGINHKSKLITEYGENLLNAANTFDIDGMLKLLKNYPENIQILKRV